MRRLNCRWPFLLLSTAVALGIVALPGNATLERDYPTLVPTDLTAAELADLQRMADQDSIGIDAAISAYAWQDRFAALADQLDSMYPNVYAGAGITDAAKHLAWIAFKGDAPATAARLTSDFPWASIALHQGRALSSKEVDERIVQVHNSVAAQK